MRLLIICAEHFVSPPLIQEYDCSQRQIGCDCPWSVEGSGRTGARNLYSQKCERPLSSVPVHRQFSDAHQYEHHPQPSFHSPFLPYAHHKNIETEQDRGHRQGEHHILKGTLPKQREPVEILQGVGQWSDAKAEDGRDVPFPPQCNVN